MFERFTEQARQVVVLAQEDARALKHNWIGTEHLLLGLLRQEDGVAARCLEDLGIGVDDVRAQVARIVGQGDEATTGQIPFTPRSKKVLELALREALSLGHDYIGSEHILLGLVRENEGVAARILLDFGVTPRQVAGALVQALGDDRPDYAERFSARGPAPETRRRESERDRPAEPRQRLLVLAAALSAVSVAVGVLVGWLIWG